MSLERAVQQTVASQPDLVRETARGEPKAWGRLAAQGILSFRSLAGRAPDDAERRAIWDALWEAVRRIHGAPTPATCGHPIDAARYGVCDVCRGSRLCMACAASHLCTDECAARGCAPGLCVKEVRDGIVSDTFGIG